MAVLPSGEYSVTLNAIFIKKKVAFALFCKSKCHFFISRFQSGNKLFTSLFSVTVQPCTKSQKSEFKLV